METELSPGMISKRYLWSQLIQTLFYVVSAFPYCLSFIGALEGVSENEPARKPAFIYQVLEAYSPTES